MPKEKGRGVTKVTPIDTIDINTADKPSMINAFKGTGIQKVTIERIMKSRPYSNIDDLESKLKLVHKQSLAARAKEELKKKLGDCEICFLQQGQLPDFKAR